MIRCDFTHSLCFFIVLYCSGKSVGYYVIDNTFIAIIYGFLCDSMKIFIRIQELYFLNFIYVLSF